MYKKNMVLNNRQQLKCSKTKPRINGNEEVLHIPQTSKIEALPSNGLMSPVGNGGKVLHISWCSRTIPRPLPIGLIKCWPNVLNGLF